MASDRSMELLMKKQKTLKAWSKKLAMKYFYLSKFNNEHLTDSQLKRLGIHLSNMDFESGQIDDCTAPHFFLPSGQERVAKYWNTAQGTSVFDDRHFKNDWENGTPYIWGQSLMAEITDHHRALVRDYPEMWAPSNFRYQPSPLVSCSSNRQYRVGKVFDAVGNNKVHQIVHLTTDCIGEDGKLTVSEAMAVIDFTTRLLANVSTRNLDEYNFSNRFDFTFPVLIVSILNPGQVRIVQGHFDGALKIQCTKLCNFNVPDYRGLLKSLLRWTIPVPCGNIMVQHSLPEVSKSSGESESSDESGVSEQSKYNTDKDYLAFCFTLVLVDIVAALWICL